MWFRSGSSRPGGARGASAAVVAAAVGLLAAAVLATPAEGGASASQAAEEGAAKAFLPLAMRHGLPPSSGTAMVRVVSRTEAMTGTIDTWDWEGGVAMVGLMRAYEATGDQAILDHVQAWMDRQIGEGTPFASATFRDPPCDTGQWPAEGVRHPNQLAPDWALAMLYMYRPRPEYRQQIQDAVEFATRRACRADGAMAHLPGQVWDDTLAMAAPVLARAAGILGRPELLDRAVDEVVAHAALLQSDDGVWFHGWSALDCDHMSGGRWARGNGWAALATTEVLAQMPPDHPDRPLVRAVLFRQLDGLARLQDPSGLWHTLVDRPDFYLETSGSAAIAAAMLAAELPEGPETSALRLSGRRALGAAYERVAADGTVLGVSAGTGVAPSLDVYGAVPADGIQPYGQGLWLIMAAAGGR
jgi:unsaturated rhamnogalacturonyl hydrolase